MTTAYLPGFEPPRTHDYWTPTPDGVIRRKGLLSAKARIWLWLIKRSSSGQWLRVLNPEIARALELDSSTVNRCMAELRAEHPPGIDHPYLATRGATTRREILVLYRGKDAPSATPPTARANARSCMQSARASARSPSTEVPAVPAVVPPAPLFERKTHGNENESSFSFPEKPPACAPARPCEGPPVPTEPPPLRSRSAAAVMERFQAAAEAVRAREGREPEPARAEPPREPLTPEIAAAREMSGGRSVDAPRPAPQADYSQGMPRAKSAATPRLRGLVHALFQTGGDPAAVGELVRHVGWLFDSTKPETVRCWTQGFGEAARLLEPDELISIIEAAGRPRVEPFKRSRYLSVALTDRLVKAKREAGARRLE